MPTGVGAKLRDARVRRRVDLREVERATKIRVRFLRAMEDEDWEALPGGAYTHSFIRTYASYLGLDGRRLAEDYRRAREEPLPGEPGAPRADPIVASKPRRRRLGGRRAVGALGVAAALVALAVIAYDEGGSGKPGSRGGQGNGRAAGPSPSESAPSRSAVPSRAISAKKNSGALGLRLVARGEVWVCLLDAKGTELIDGAVLPPAAEEGPFRSDSFTVSFGNGEVSMWIDGQEAVIADSPDPLGYEIDSDGGLRQLTEAERPTCA